MPLIRFHYYLLFFAPLSTSSSITTEMKLGILMSLFSASASSSSQDTDIAAAVAHFPITPPENISPQVSFHSKPLNVPDTTCLLKLDTKETFFISGSIVSSFGLIGIDTEDCIPFFIVFSNHDDLTRQSLLMTDATHGQSFTIKKLASNRPGFRKNAVVSI